MTNEDDKLITALQQVIRGAARILAILMVVMIVLGVIDVGWPLYEKLVA